MCNGSPYIFSFKIRSIIHLFNNCVSDTKVPHEMGRLSSLCVGDRKDAVVAF
jgi:hypothetical protein